MKSRPGRNDKCHCGSGKKYKKCCLDKDEQAAREHLIATESTPEIRHTPEGITEIVDEDNLIDLPDIEADEKPPSLSDQDNAAIDSLWDTQTELFNKKDIDGILCSLNNFFDQHSDLLIHSGIEDQIFNMENLFYEQNRADDYYNLLSGILERAPELYMMNFGYFDHSRIKYIVSRARYSEINSLLARYADDPVSHCDTLAWTIDLLSWIGAEYELESFIEKTIKTILLSDEIWDKWAFHRWHLLFLYVNNLNSDKSTAEIASKIHRFISEEYSDLFSIPENNIKRELDKITSDIPEWTITYTEKKDGIVDFFVAMKWQLVKFMRLRYSYGWIQSSRITIALTNYWIHHGTGKGKKNGTYLITEHKVKNYLRSLDPVDAVCILQGVWYFAEFLFFNKRIDIHNRKILQDISLKLYENTCKHLEPSSPIPGSITTFPEMISTPDIAPV